MHQAVNEPMAQTTLTQYSVNKGLKVFGAPGADAVIKELRQLHDRDVIKPKEARELSWEERLKALQYIMFLKQK
jgi:hypothetical protein